MRNDQLSGPELDAINKRLTDPDNPPKQITLDQWSMQNQPQIIEALENLIVTLSDFKDIKPVEQPKLKRRQFIAVTAALIVGISAGMMSDIGGKWVVKLYPQLDPSYSPPNVEKTNADEPNPVTVQLGEDHPVKDN